MLLRGLSKRRILGSLKKCICSSSYFKVNPTFIDGDRYLEDDDYYSTFQDRLLIAMPLISPLPVPIDRGAVSKYL